MNILVEDEHIAAEAFTLEQLIKLAPVHLQLEERVPTGQGEAFDLKAWYRAWAASKGKGGEAEPTHLQVEAVDEFRADIPWSELDHALFVYAHEGRPLTKGYPLRLYVPDGSSECLNVKSVVKLRFLYDSEQARKASYGFKNTVSLDALKGKK